MPHLCVMVDCARNIYQRINKYQVSKVSKLDLEMKGKRMTAQVLPHVNLNNMTDVLAGIHENQVYQAVRIQDVVEGGT